MNIVVLRDMVMALPHASEGDPFGPTVLVYKVGGKMFAMIPIDEPRISLKNTPEKNVELREEHDYIQAAWHMNKTHWNMILMDQNPKMSLVKELIHDSYTLVFDSLPKKIKESLIG